MMIHKEMTMFNNNDDDVDEKIPSSIPSSVLEEDYEKMTISNEMTTTFNDNKNYNDEMTTSSIP